MAKSRQDQSCIRQAVLTMAKIIKAQLQVGFEFLQFLVEIILTELRRSDNDIVNYK